MSSDITGPELGPMEFPDWLLYKLELGDEEVGVLYAMLVGVKISARHDEILAAWKAYVEMYASDWSDRVNVVETKLMAERIEAETKTQNTTGGE